VEKLYRVIFSSLNILVNYQKSPKATCREPQVANLCTRQSFFCLSQYSSTNKIPVALLPYENFHI